MLYARMSGLKTAHLTAVQASGGSCLSRTSACRQHFWSKAILPVRRILQSNARLLSEAYCMSACLCGPIRIRSLSFTFHSTWLILCGYINIDSKLSGKLSQLSLIQHIPFHRFLIIVLQVFNLFKECRIKGSQFLS